MSRISTATRCSAGETSDVYTEEPSYMFFARANVRDGLMSTPSVVAGLVRRIDELEAKLRIINDEDD